jgi:predicted adenylyl cyclase CyaB
MGQNVEIKAYATDFVEQSKIARSLAGAEPEVIYQKDIFFNVPKGRLKLRVFTQDRAVLVYYNRSDQQGPKLSQYELSETNDPEGLESILKSAYGIRNTVVKLRHLYMSGRTRIHFDKVESLGEFIELEVVLSDSDQLVDGEKEAQKLMDKLGIETDRLIDVAYVDLLDSETV